jgi:hypothetical protein
VECVQVGRSCRCVLTYSNNPLEVCVGVAVVRTSTTRQYEQSAPDEQRPKNRFVVSSQPQRQQKLDLYSLVINAGCK